VFLGNDGGRMVSSRRNEKAVSDYPSAFAAVGQVSSYMIYSIDRNKLAAEPQKDR
jgi:hypothetical protein